MSNWWLLPLGIVIGAVVVVLLLRAAYYAVMKQVMW